MKENEAFLALGADAYDHQTALTAVNNINNFFVHLSIILYINRQIDE